MTQSGKVGFVESSSQAPGKFEPRVLQALHSAQCAAVSLEERNILGSSGDRRCEDSEYSSSQE